MASKSSQPRINLNFQTNSACSTCASKERKAKTEDHMCTEIQSVTDGLPVRCVGEWAYEKIYYLVQYFGIFSNGMKNQWKLNYIEICSGPGRCVMRENGKELDGTALAIAGHKAFPNLQSATFIDFNPAVTKVLQTRLSALNANSATAVTADFSDIAGLRKTLQGLPNGLNLVLVDPTECNVPFETIRCIKDELKSADFIINVAIGTDANRNLVDAALNSRFAKVRKKYADFLGDDSFFTDPDVVDLAKRKDHAGLRDLFRRAYKAKLQGIGLSEIDERQVRHFYTLIFASGHKKGLDFWKKANTYDPDNQKRLF